MSGRHLLDTSVIIALFHEDAAVLERARDARLPVRGSAMRAPRRRRPLIRVISPPPPEVDRELLAASTSYVGGPEHKETPSFAGQPRPRADAAKCDPSLANRRTLVTRWLRTAIRRGVTSAYWEGSFPRYVWYMHRETVFEGRLVNRESGQYKGYPLNEDEWPTDIRQYYE